MSVEPLFLLSQIYRDRGGQAQARAELVKASTVQPANPLVWIELGTYDLKEHQPVSAVADLQRAHALYPASQAILKQLQQAQAAAVQAQQQAAALQQPAPAQGAAPPSPGASPASGAPSPVPGAQTPAP